MNEDLNKILSWLELVVERLVGQDLEILRLVIHEVRLILTFTIQAHILSK